MNFASAEVAMQEDVAAALARLGRRERFTDRDDFVFVSDAGGFVDGSAVRRRFLAAAKTAGLRRLRFHDLRHSFGTIAVNGVLSLRELQEWLGHADARTTARYTHYKKRGDEAKRLAEAFKAAWDTVDATEEPVETSVS
jgi:integrase